MILPPPGKNPAGGYGCELVRITILRLSSEPGTVRKSVSQQRSQPFYNQIGGSIVVFGSMSRLL